MRKFLLLVNVINVCFSFSQSLNLNLTACYAFNTNALEPINSLTGTLSAASLTADRFTYAGSAYLLNGTTASYIELPDNPLIKPANDITFSAWVKPATLANSHLLFTKNSATVNIQAYQLAIVTTTAGFGFQASKANATDYNAATGSSSITINTWYHVAFTMDNSFIKLYVNGVLESSTTVTYAGYDYTVGKKVYLGGSNELILNPDFAVELSCKT